MSSLVWLWDKVAGNLLWWIILILSAFAFKKIRPWLKRAWQWCVGLFKKGSASTLSTAPVKTTTIDTVGVWFLVLAIFVLALWDRKLERDIHRVQAEMIRYVLPRDLTKEQIKAFGDYLASHSKPHEVIIKYIPGDEEAMRYASDFSEAFRAGNWLPNMRPINPAAITCQPNPAGTMSSISCNSELQLMQGATLTSSGPSEPENPATIEEKVHPPPTLGMILTEALKVGNIREPDYAGGGGRQNPPEGVTVILFIGARHRDKYAIMPTNWLERSQREGRLLSDIQDDDFK